MSAVEPAAVANPAVSGAKPAPKRVVVNQVPEEIVNNPVLNRQIAATLPNNYNFEIHKTIWRLKTIGCRRVALQFPEGLFVFSVAIADLLETFAGVEVVIFGDVTYGGCCIDDFTATASCCDAIVHYAHSCLVPVGQMTGGVRVLYVFVDIKIDLWHLVETVKKNFTPGDNRLAMASTIQFVSSLHTAAKELRNSGFDVFVPQSKPLSPGEVLGCTASRLLNTVTDIVFTADGRFHLEALMIANPTVRAFKYNPYNKELTREWYDFDKMLANRSAAIEEATAVCKKSGVFGLILGTLGRQGSPRVLDHLTRSIEAKTGRQVTFLLPEIQPATLNAIRGVDCWAQIACPRLSIDWGVGFTDKPLLTPFELSAAVGTVAVKGGEERRTLGEYPMDFYSTASLGPWTPNHKCQGQCTCGS